MSRVDSSLVFLTLGLIDLGGNGEMFGVGLPYFDQILQHLTHDPNMMVANLGETTIDSHAPNTNLLLNPWAAGGGSKPIKLVCLAIKK